MEAFPAYQTKRINDLARGEWFFFEKRERTHIGLAIDPARNGDRPALVAVFPGHPDSESGEPGVLDGSTVANQPLLVLPDTRIVLPQRPEGIRFGYNQLVAPAGAAFLIDDQIGVAALYGGRNRMIVSTKDGSILSGDDLHRRAWFASWEIATKDVNGEWQPICRVTAASP